MKKLNLTLATSHYDHMADLLLGRVPVQGIDLTYLDLQVEEIFFRMVTYRDFDVSEISMAKFSSLASQGDSPFVGIPVFPSRVFRHSSIYVSAAAGTGRGMSLPPAASTLKPIAWAFEGCSV